MPLSSYVTTTMCINAYNWGLPAGKSGDVAATGAAAFSQ